MTDLAHQSVDATIITRKATEPATAEEQQQIVDFETRLFTAQTRDRLAGELRTMVLRRTCASLHSALFYHRQLQRSFSAPRLQQPGGLVTPGDGRFTTNILTSMTMGQIEDDDHMHEPPRDFPSLVGSALQHSADSHQCCRASTMTSPPGGWSLAAFHPAGKLRHLLRDAEDRQPFFSTPLNIGTGDPLPINLSSTLEGLDLSYLPEITVCKKNATSGFADRQLQNHNRSWAGLDRWQVRPCWQN